MLSISAIVVIAYIALLQLVVFTIVNSSSSSSSTSTSASVHSILKIRGGLVPQASDSNGGNYYEQYTLDYGSSDNKRMAGALRGFIRTGSISSSPEADPFFKWLNNHLETGSEAITGRLKPFYAADFGSKSDLKKGEYPKIIIVERRLETDDKGYILNPAEAKASLSPKKVDVTIKEIRNPFWRARCNFAVRYIIPNRVNIIKIMESKGRFSNEIVANEVVNSNGKSQQVMTGKVTFKPRLIERLLGKKNIVMYRKITSNFNKQ